MINLDLNMPDHSDKKEKIFTFKCTFHCSGALKLFKMHYDKYLNVTSQQHGMTHVWKCYVDTKLAVFPSVSSYNIH